jgi:predicted nucleic acid-binding protein
MAESWTASSQPVRYNRQHRTYSTSGPRCPQSRGCRCHRKCWKRCVRTNASVLYLDSSALVKLVIEEAESASLQRYLRDWPRRATSSLARLEVVRAVSIHGTAVVARARQLLAGLHLLQISNAILDEAADLAPGPLRRLDAIHLASARHLRADLGRMVTYDLRLASAAEGIGMAVESPGA